MVAMTAIYGAGSPALVPQDAKSELNLPSAGSTGHHLGQCRRSGAERWPPETGVIFFGINIAWIYIATD